MMAIPLDLSVVIPVLDVVLDEEESLPVLWPELRAVLDGTGFVYEVIFVDDGCRDRSAEIVRGLRDADPRVRLVRLKENAGETAATDAGFKAARALLIVTMDADLQNDPRDIPALLAHLQEWDAVTGWRVNRADGDGPLRRISSRIANRIRNALSDGSIRDSGCTFRAFRRECLEDLVPYAGFHRFIPTLLRMRGFRVLEVPVRHRPRRFGRSKYGIRDRAVRALWDLLVVRWIKRRMLRYEVAEDLRGSRGRSEASPVRILLAGLGRWAPGICGASTSWAPRCGRLTRWWSGGGSPSRAASIRNGCSATSARRRPTWTPWTW